MDLDEVDAALTRSISVVEFFDHLGDIARQPLVVMRGVRASALCCGAGRGVLRFIPPPRMLRRRCRRA